MWHRSFVDSLCCTDRVTSTNAVHTYCVVSNWADFVGSEGPHLLVVALGKPGCWWADLVPHLKELRNRRAASPLRFDLLRVTGRAAQGCSTFGEGETRRFAIVRVPYSYRDAIGILKKSSNIYGREQCWTIANWWVWFQIWRKLGFLCSIWIILYF